MRKSLCMAGRVDAARNAYQAAAVRTARSTRESYTLSGWAKGYGVAARAREGCPDAQFRLRAVVKYYDTAYREYGIEEYTADFSPCTEEWQFASVRFAKEMIISLLWHLKSVLYNIPAGLAEIKKLFPKNY